LFIVNPQDLEGIFGALHCPPAYRGHSYVKEQDLSLDRVRLRFILCPLPFPLRSWQYGPHLELRCQKKALSLDGNKG